MKQKKPRHSRSRDLALTGAMCGGQEAYRREQRPLEDKSVRLQHRNRIVMNSRSWLSRRPLFDAFRLRALWTGAKTSRPTTSLSRRRCQPSAPALAPHTRASPFRFPRTAAEDSCAFLRIVACNAGGGVGDLRTRTGGRRNTHVP